MSEACDILIIGAGASGAAAAWNLSKKNKNIVCMEQGPWMDPSKYPSTSQDWEIKKTRDYSPFPNIRNLKHDYSINDENSAISIAMFNAVGGSTILYSGHFPRFHPSDFKSFTLDGVGHDWPLSYKELEEYYKINDAEMGVSGLEGDPAYPEITNLMPPVDIGLFGEIIGKGFNKLGWHWWPSYSAIITREKDGRGRCINLGPCNTGCPQGAKSSVDITYWPKAIKNGVNLKTKCRVSQILVDKKDKAIGALYFDDSGAEKRIFADKVILACNGIGTPRILLNSSSRVRNETLGNRSGQVGKNLMLHPLGFVEGYFDKNIDSKLGPHGSCILSQEFYETSEQNNFKRGFTMQVLRAPEAVEMSKSAIQRRMIPIANSNWEEKFNELYNRSIGISIICEDLPEESNYVELDDSLKDSNGIPCPKVFYKLGENTKKIMSFGIDRGKEVLEAAGANQIFSFGPVRNTGWHLMGTAKMGDNRENSVVNKNGMCHDVENLYIVDSSIFPTCASVNPASTIQALALYISDKIIK